MFRSEDQALLDRLRDEQLMETLWRAYAPAAAPALHPRASGMLVGIRGAFGLPEAPGPALGSVRTLLHAPSYRDLPPPLLHHVAVFFERVADAQPPHELEAVIEARTRSLAAWLALRPSSYLAELCHAVLGAGLASTDVERRAAQAVRAPIESVGAQARAGAADRTVPARAALRVLRRLDDACTLAGADAVLRQEVSELGARLVRLVVDDALAPAHDDIADATVKGRAESDGAALMAAIADVWRWADEDEDVERFAVDQVTPIAWNVYRERTWNDLRALLAPLVPLIDRMALRIEADPRYLPYAARCAQMFVFRSEAATAAERERELAERALRLCPTHRNGRLILAGLLVADARGALDGGLPDLDGVTALLDRAESLYPRATGLAEQRERLAAKRAERGSWQSRMWGGR